MLASGRSTSKRYTIVNAIESQQLSEGGAIIVAETTITGASQPSQSEAREQPLVTFVVPCYNSAEYMQRAIDSLVEVATSCEILLVNDGSTDSTADIARRYEQRYPQVIAIDQENANWGGVVNRGIERARGTYFKVLDSDDYFDELALRRVLESLELARAADNAPDLLITNYVYDHMGSGSQRVMQYRKFFPVGRVIRWDEISLSQRDKVYQDEFIMIHAAWYKTAILRESGVRLPEGVSYMDSLLLLHPMPHTKTLLYLDVAPYHYIIGRIGQSVEIDVVKKHIDEQILASKLAIDDYDYAELYRDDPPCAMLMTGYVSCMMSVSTIHLFMIGTPEALAKNRELWNYLIDKNPALYENVRKSWAGRANRKTALGRSLALAGYAFAQRVYKFA